MSRILPKERNPQSEYVVLEKKHFIELFRYALMSQENPTTGLANRNGLTSFWLEMQRGLDRQGIDPTMVDVAVIYGDLENFKLVNERWGYEVGDRVLYEVGQRVQRCIRPGEKVGNPHGDEYVAIVFGDDESAKTVGERLSEQVHKKEIRGRNSRGEAYSVKPAIRLKHVVVRASDSLDQVLDLADQEFFDKPKGEN